MSGVECRAAEWTSRCTRQAVAETAPVAVVTQIGTRSGECGTAEWAARCARHVGAAKVSTVQKIDSKVVEYGAAEWAGLCTRQAATKTPPVAVATKINTKRVDCSNAE